MGLLHVLVINHLIATVCRLFETLAGNQLDQ
jgi:hypothetical protein